MISRCSSSEEIVQYQYCLERLFVQFNLNKELVKSNHCTLFDSLDHWIHCLSCILNDFQIIVEKLLIPAKRSLYGFNSLHFLWFFMCDFNMLWNYSKSLLYIVAFLKTDPRRDMRHTTKLYGIIFHLLSTQSFLNIFSASSYWLLKCYT